MGFSRQEYWSGLPCLPPGDLPNPGIEPRSPALPTDSLLSQEYVYIHATLLLLGEASLGSPLTTPVSTTPGRYGYIIPTLVGIILPEHPPVSSQP